MAGLEIQDYPWLEIRRIKINRFIMVQYNYIYEISNFGRKVAETLTKIVLKRDQQMRLLDPVFTKFAWFVGLIFELFLFSSLLVELS